jgi:twitching motility protein PilU
VILIGEVRDRETMEHAIMFAETGHLCLCTLHANNTNQAMDRILNFFPEDRREQLLMDLSLNTKAVVSQRLVRTVDGVGRRAAVEILINTPLMADLILKGDIPGMKELMARSKENGMQTFDMALFDLIEEGAINLDEGLRNADSVNDLRLRLKLEGKRGEKTDLFEEVKNLKIQGADK